MGIEILTENLAIVEKTDLFTLIILDDAMVISTEQLSTWREWQDRFPQSYKTSLDLGKFEEAAEYLEFDYPTWFGRTARTWRGVLRVLECNRHVISALFHSK